MLRKDLGDIIDRICAIGMAFSISTNGTLIFPDLIATIRRRQLMKVSVSLDGTETFHNELRGRPDAYQQALEGVRLLSRSGIKTAVAMAITRDNCRMVEPVLQAAIECGAAFFVVNQQFALWPQTT